VRVCFFTGVAPIGHLAYDVAVSRHSEHEWREVVLDTAEKQRVFEAERHEPELIISFLNPYVVPVRYLTAAGGRAFNVHPSSPAYPGNDPLHFAAYDGCFTAGATLHLMRDTVDCGPICDVWERPVDSAEGIVRLRELSLHMSVGILLHNLDAILDGSIEPNGRTWTAANRHTRADFIEKCRIDPGIEAAELARRLRAFYHPGYRNRPFVEVHGRRFVYDGPEVGP